MDLVQAVASAEEAAGSDAYGPDGDVLFEALDVLARSANEEANLDARGNAVFTGMVVSLLQRRLEIERWYDAHPEIDEQEVEAVLFGLGLPRTGSTALGYLLAQDSRVRSLRTWEANQPTPPPELDREHEDPRFLAARAALGSEPVLPPEIMSVFPTSPDGPAECLELLSMSFRCSQLDTVAQTPSYGEWLLECDYGPAYRYHERVLKLLQWRRPPNRWRLKSPAHMFGIEALDDVYPHARFVITHRDPAAVVPSVASVETAVVRMFTGRADPEYFGRHCLESWDHALQRFIAFRNRSDEGRFYDIAYTDMQRDPVETVRGLYEWLGEDLTDEVATAMQTWWNSSQRDRTTGGGHRYTAADFGLDAAELDERFAYYRDRFPPFV
jgi:hypothetical protein